MTIVIKQGMSKRQIETALKKLKPHRRKEQPVPDINQFAGTVTLKEDPLVIQKKMRDEWN